MVVSSRVSSDASSSGVRSRMKTPNAVDFFRRVSVRNRCSLRAFPKRPARSVGPALRTLGPRDERRVRATDFAAWMFAFCASMPRIRLLLPCSCCREERGRRGERKRGDAGDREAVGTLARSRRGVAVRADLGCAATRRRRTLMMMKGRPNSSNARLILPTFARGQTSRRDEVCGLERARGAFRGVDRRFEALGLLPRVRKLHKQKVRMGFISDGVVNRGLVCGSSLERTRLFFMRQHEESF